MEQLFIFRVEFKVNMKDHKTSAPRKKASGNIPVMEERLELGKKIIEKGRLRIIKKVDEKTVDVPLVSRETGYLIERIPVNRYVDDAPPPVRYEGKTMILSVVEEEVIIQKRLKLVEEVRISATENESVKNTQVTLKKERVVVERHPATD